MNASGASGALGTFTLMSFLRFGFFRFSLRFPMFGCDPDDLIIFVQDLRIVFMDVGEHASAAVLEPVFCVLEISSAFRAQGVKRAVAEEAVELLRFAGIVAGEKFTFFVLEKGKLFL